MECYNCGYKGEPEFGDFQDKELLMTLHIRCPQCQSIRHITIMPEDRIKMAILYPEYCSGSPDWRALHGTGHITTRKVIDIDAGGAYCIYCPVCEWGEGGGLLPKDKTDTLRKLLVESLKSPIP